MKLLLNVKIFPKTQVYLKERTLKSKLGFQNTFECGFLKSNRSLIKFLTLLFYNFCFNQTRINKFNKKNQKVKDYYSSKESKKTLMLRGLLLSPTKGGLHRGGAPQPSGGLRVFRRGGGALALQARSRQALPNRIIIITKTFIFIIATLSIFVQPKKKYQY